MLKQNKSCKYKRERGYGMKGVLSGGWELMLKWVLSFLSRLKLIACFICVSTWVVGTQVVFGSEPEIYNFTPKGISLDESTVDLYTGDMNLKIPLFTVPGRGELDYPVELTYKAGIRVNQMASWVGLGFDLCPGVITREVVSWPDDYWKGKENVHFFRQIEVGPRKWYEQIIEGIFQFFISGGMGFSVSWGNNDGTEIKPYVSGRSVSVGETDIDIRDQKFSDGGFLYTNHHNLEDEDPRDGATPDLYYLSGIGKSNKLVLSGSPNSRKFHLQRTCGQTSSNSEVDDAVRIEYELSASISNGIKKFVITEKDGTKYVYAQPLLVKSGGWQTRFEGKVPGIIDDIDTKGRLKTEFLDPYPYKWLLTAILSPDYIDGNGDLIPDNGGDDKGNWVKFNYQVDGEYNFHNPSDGGEYEGRNDKGFKTYFSSWGKRELAHLTSIETPTHKASFVATSNGSNHPPMKLAEIQLYNKNNSSEIIKSIYCEYNNSNPLCSGAPESPVGKLTLSKITEYGRGGKNGGNALPPTRFEYYSQNPTWDKYKWDRWGYYYSNGSIDNHNSSCRLENIIPQAWSLTKVIYPTGGTIEWEYESDRYAHVGNKAAGTGRNEGLWGVIDNDYRTQYGGGIRVKTITISDGLGNKQIVRYLYNVKGYDLEEGDGDANNYGESSGATPIEPPPCESLNDRIYIGSHEADSYVGYCKVTVIPGYDSNNSTARPSGYSVHEFTNAYTHPNEGDEWQYDMDYRRGLLTKITYYTQEDKAIKIVENKYTFEDQATWSGGKEKLTSGWAKLNTYKTAYNGVESIETRYLSGSKNGSRGAQEERSNKKVSIWWVELAIYNVWAIVDVSYGITFNEPPQLSVSANNYWGGMQVIENRTDGFKAKCYVLKDIYDIAGDWIQEWYPNPPEGVVFTWSASGNVTIGTVSTYQEINYLYNPINGLVGTMTEHGNDGNRVTQNTYAFQYYDDMKNKHMINQVGTVTIQDQKLNNYTLANRRITLYKDFDDTEGIQIYPVSEYRWLDKDGDKEYDAGENTCTTTYVDYDAYGNLLQKTDANGNSTYYYFGDNDNPRSNSASELKHAYCTSIKNALGHYVDTYYNENGDIDTLTDANGNSTIYRYNIFGRLEKIIKPEDTLDSPTIQYSYHYGNFSSDDDLNRIIISEKINNEIKKETTKYYNGLGQLIKTKTKTNDTNTIISHTKTWNNKTEWKGCAGEGIDITNSGTVKRSIVTKEIAQSGLRKTSERVCGHRNKQFFDGRLWTNQDVHEYTMEYVFFPSFISSPQIKSYSSNGVGASNPWWSSQDSNYCGLVSLDSNKIILRTFAFEDMDGDGWHGPSNPSFSFNLSGLIYVSLGSLLSPLIDFGSTLHNYGTFSANVDFHGLPMISIKIKTQSSDTSEFTWEESKAQEVTGHWQNGKFVGIINSPVKRYLRWKVYLEGCVSTASEELLDVTINYTSSGESVCSKVEYNEIGKIKKEYSPYIESEGPNTYTEYHYDSLFRTYKIIYPEPTGVVTITHRNDNAGFHLVTTKDENGHYKRTTFDKLGRLVKVEEDSPDEGETYNLTTNYTYDILDNLTIIQDKDGHETKYTYDTLNRLLAVDHLDSGRREYQYDLNGNLRFSRDAEQKKAGNWVEYRYDKLDRVIAKGILNYTGSDPINDPKVNNPQSSEDFIQKVSYTYDQGINGTGNRTNMIDDVGVTNYSYDRCNRLIQQRRKINGVGQTYTTTYHYNSAGNIDWIITPSNKKIIYSYNIFNRVDFIEVEGLNKIVEKYLYEPNGDISSITYNNQFITNYDYYPRGWMKKVTVVKTSPIFHRYYKYEPAGNLKEEYNELVQTNTPFVVYDYDSIDRLISIDYNPTSNLKIEYDYDEIGNRTWSRVQDSSGTSIRNYTYYASHPNRLISDNLYNYTYYDNGNLKSKSYNGITFTYLYDYENRLVEVNQDGKWLEGYVYDGDGKRVKKFTNDGTITLVALYHYNAGGEIIYEENFSTKTVQSVVLFKDNFETLPEPNVWTTTGLWHRAQGKGYNSNYSFAYNNGSNYNTGGRNSGILTSPTIDLTKVTTAKLRFWTRWQHESYSYGDYDNIKVEVWDGKSWNRIFYNDCNEGQASTNWHEELLDISAYAGKLIKVRFCFDTVDGWYNDYEGWYIDNVRVEPSSFNADFEKEEAPQDNLWLYDGLWNRSKTKNYSSQYCFAYNNGTNYDTGRNRNFGALTSPFIDLTTVNNATLKFKTRWQHESYSYGDYDNMRVEIYDGISWHRIFYNDCNEGPCYKDWHEESFDISPYTINNIKLKFSFDTVDGWYNDYEGWYIDDIEIITISEDFQQLKTIDITSLTPIDNIFYIHANEQVIARVEHPLPSTKYQTYYYHNDYLGSPRVITNSLDDNYTTQDYYPFGGKASPGSAYKIGFTGKRFDEKTGLYYYGARYYNSELGRFIISDPAIERVPSQRILREPQRLNPYAYGINNPLKYVDPDGEAAETVWDVTSLGVGVVEFAMAPSWIGAGAIIVDLGATFIPGVPGGAGVALKTARAGEKAAEKIGAALKAVKSGERGIANPKVAEAIAKGRAIHKLFKADEVLEGIRIKEFRLPSGKKVDFIDLEKKIIYELKPNNPSAIKLGEKQLQNYLKEVESLYGSGWKTILETY
ncbi:MAG: RHS repeat-associated core domain-containing protein [bacterium]